MRNFYKKIKNKISVPTTQVTKSFINLQGQLNAKRQALVDAAWLKFDLDGNGFVEMNEVKYVENIYIYNLLILVVKIIKKFLGKSTTQTFILELKAEP